MRRPSNLYLTGASVMLLLLFIQLYVNLMPGLNQATNASQAGQALTVQPGLKPAAIRQLLTTGNYYTDSRDIALIADSLPGKIARNGPLDNLGGLNKRPFAIQTPVTWRSPVGGVDFQSRLQLSRQQMGFDSVLYTRERTNPKPYPATVNTGSGSVSITGTVARDEQPLAGVLVQLKRHPATAQPDTLRDRYTYARTGTDGRFTFFGLSQRFGLQRGTAQTGFRNLATGGARAGSPATRTITLLPGRITSGSLAQSPTGNSKPTTPSPSVPRRRLRGSTGASWRGFCFRSGPCRGSGRCANSGRIPCCWQC